MADFLAYTEKFFKQNGLINDNADAKIITPIIILVQDIYLHPILGTKLFNDIKAEIIAGSISTENQTLLDDYLMKVMLWYTLCECTPAFKYRYMNKNVMSKSSENSTPADLSEIKFLMDKWKNNAELYAQRTTIFLRNNTDTYPLYLTNVEPEEIRPNRNNFTAGLYLGDDDEECCPGYYD